LFHSRRLTGDSFFFSLFQVKLDKSHSGKPSRVIHIRNIPNEVSEAEIIHLGLPFGRVTNVLVLKGKNQVSASILIRLLSAGFGQVYVESSRESLTDTDREKRPFAKLSRPQTARLTRAISLTKTINDVGDPFDYPLLSAPRRTARNPLDAPLPRTDASRACYFARREPVHRVSLYREQRFSVDRLVRFFSCERSRSSGKISISLARCTLGLSRVHVPVSCPTSLGKLQVFTRARSSPAAVSLLGENSTSLRVGELKPNER